jgi:ubiquinone/menaquinone biosynthesis C-methylase UbiE
MTTISDTYNKMLADGVNDAERVGWGSADSQEKRFSVLTEIGDLDNDTILDVGCGLGAYFDYIHNAYPNLSYTGVDINLNMIQEAQQKHSDIEFIHTDITSDSHALNDRKFDYVFLSGALNLSTDKHHDTIENIMKQMFALANKGVAANFLSLFSDYLTPGEYYCNPENILQTAFSITKKITLRHDYMPHDFTIYLYK